MPHFASQQAEDGMVSRRKSSETPHTPEHVESTMPSLGEVDTPIVHCIRKPRLLLVDDNKLNLQLLHTFVKRNGYDVDLCQLAEDGAQAVNVFQTFSPDIIFMDISMPIMDGIEATRNIRQLEMEMRESDDSTEVESIKPSFIVAITGNANENDRDEALNSGVDIYLTKPVSFKEVRKVL